jgi:ankyrin repeat protein
VFENQVKAAKLLIKFGASIDARTISNRTPLHIASILGQQHLCQLLLDKGADINLQDFERNTATHYATTYSN